MDKGSRRRKDASAMIKKGIREEEHGGERESMCQ